MLLCVFDLTCIVCVLKNRIKASTQKYFYIYIYTKKKNPETEQKNKVIGFWNWISQQTVTRMSSRHSYRSRQVITCLCCITFFRLISRSLWISNEISSINASPDCSIIWMKRGLTWSSLFMRLRKWQGWLVNQEEHGQQTMYVVLRFFVESDFV
jgi:hypothetical protein